MAVARRHVSLRRLAAVARRPVPLRLLAAIAPLALGLIFPVGCAIAPYAGYRGQQPQPGAVTPFDDRAARVAATDVFAPGTTDRAHHMMGVLRLAQPTDSLVIIVYGDNRPGLRLTSTPWGLGAIMDADSRDPWSYLWAAANVPVMLIQSVVPTLDGLRDIASSKWTHRYSGGGEARVLEAFAREGGAALVINTGDLVERGPRGEHWERFTRRHAKLRSAVPFLAAPGNHERLSHPLGRFNWNAAMGAPADTMRYWYAFDLPESLARIVVLDSNLFADPKKRYPDALQRLLADEQLAWADSVLAASRARYRFVVMHHPLVSAGQHFSDWQADPNAAGRRAQLLEMFMRHRVTAVVAGHEHLYQRLYIHGPGGRGLWQITSGGGGSPLHRISRVERRDALGVKLPEGYRVRWEDPVSEYHYCRLVFPAHPAGASGPRLEALRVTSSGGSEPLESVDLSTLPSTGGSHVGP